jgi:hypothetical protein
LGQGTWLGVGNDPRYTPTTTFETFPFPEGLTLNIQATRYAGARYGLSMRHRDLDPAVAAAYGWPADISEENALAKLLDLNLSGPRLLRDFPATQKQSKSRVAHRLKRRGGRRSSNYRLRAASRRKNIYRSPSHN